jgi:SAM-dependent methyltransferase
MDAWFKTWFNSPYYHILYKNRSQQEADDFVKKCIESFNFQANQTLLDVACGKGRHARAFAAASMDVTGVDLSEESILFARQFETEKLHFHIHDMRRVFRVNYFDYVTNLFTSFGYFKNEHENRLAATSMMHAVKPGGYFLIDFVNQQFAFDAIKKHQEETIVLENVTFTIKKVLAGNRLIKQIQVIDGQRKEEHQESLNSFSYSEMISLFESTGLTMKAIYGDYQLAEYNEMSSPRMIILFQK